MGNLISRKKKTEKYAIKSPYDNKVKSDRRTTSRWDNVTNMRTEPNNSERPKASNPTGISDVYPAVAVAATLYSGDEDYKPSPAPVEHSHSSGGHHGDGGGHSHSGDGGHSGSDGGGCSSD